MTLIGDVPAPFLPIRPGPHPFLRSSTLSVLGVGRSRTTDLEYILHDKLLSFI